MKRIIVLMSLVLGVATGFWYYEQVTEYGYYPTPNDFVQTLLSVFRRQYVVLSNTVSWLINMAQGKQEDYASIAATTIAKFEGFSAHAYPDADGFSIGYGHFITEDDPYDASSVIDEATGYQLLLSDLGDRIACVNGAVKVDLTPNQRAALISLTYNIGCGAFQSSTLLKLLNAGDYDGAAAQFSVWRKSQGTILDALVSRRAQETELFNS